MARINAHDLAPALRGIIDGLLESGRSVRRVVLIRQHGRSAIGQLEHGGHLVEAISGELVPSPLTVKELKAYRPWKPGEEKYLRKNWSKSIRIQDVAAALNRTGGDVLQHAWSMDLTRKNRFDDDFITYAPAWRIRRLRLMLAETERRGANGRDDGGDLAHRALRRRFQMGRALAGDRLNHFQKWSKADVKALTRMRFEARTVAVIARLLKRTPVAVINKLREIGISLHARWTLEEDRILTTGVAQKLLDKAIAAKLPARSVKAVKARVYVLRLTGSRAFRPWTEKERVALREAVRRGENIKEFAVWVGRGYSGVRYQSRVMGLVHPDGTMNKQFTTAEDARIRAGWARGEKPGDIAGELARPVRGVYQRAFKLGVTGENANFRRRITPADISTIRKMVAAGAGGQTIAEALGRTKQAIYRIAYNNGISFKRPVIKTFDVKIKTNSAARANGERGVAA